MKIFSAHCKRTDFLRFQVESLNEFCPDSFEYYCIDNFLNQSQSEFIKNECKILGVNYIKFDNYLISGTSLDHALALNSIKNIANDDDIVVILDFDFFMIDKFSFVDYISDYDISGIYMQRNDFEKEYIASFIAIINKNISQIDFDGGEGCDVGGNTRFYIKNKNVKWMKHTSYLNRIQDIECFNFDYDPAYCVQVVENCFVHYFRGSNWDNKNPNFHESKTKWLRELLIASKDKKIINQKYLNKCQTEMTYSLFNWNGIAENHFKSQLNPFFNT